MQEKQERRSAADMSRRRIPAAAAVKTLNAEFMASFAD
ncbi:hypothetical protein M728_005028 (plasmid) [Ensifer sp. WSM1721]